jgi:type II secretion system protein N
MIGAAALMWLLISFSVSLYVNFPATQLIDYLRWQVQDATDGSMALTTDRARLWRLTGVALQDVTLLKVPQTSRRASEEESEPTMVLRSEQVAVRAEILSLLRGQQAARFSTDLYDGDLIGRVAREEAGWLVDASAESLNLALIPIMGEEWSVNASGLLTLDADLNIADKIKQSEGTISLMMSGLIIEGGEVMGFDFTEPTPFSEAVLKLEAEDGKLEIREGSFVSDPVEIELDGYVSLAKTLRRMRLRINIKLKLSESLDKMVKNLPQAKNARDDEGTYHFTLTGNPESPRFSEDRAVMRRNRTSGPPGAARQRIEDARRASEEGLSEEEVGRVRADRLERMRERMGGNGDSNEGQERPRPSLRGAGDRPDVLNRNLGEPFVPNDNGPIDDDDFDDDDDIIDEEEFDDDDLIDDEGFE